MIRKRWFLTIVVLCLLGVSLLPFDTIFVPEWTIRVVDENGAPYKGLYVAQYCTNYILNIHPCEGAADASKATDGDGYVTFPERKIRASLLYRIVRPVLSYILSFVHGGSGVHGDLVSTGPQGYADLKYTPGESLPKEFVIPSGEHP